MTRRWWISLIVATACARGGSGGTDTPDAQPDAMECTKQTFYRDADGDGHGNPASPVQACTPPVGTVAIGDDCDDTNAQRYPGLQEVCDLIDNDCNPTTAEICPTGCTAIRRPAPDDLAHSYLVCVTSATWTNANTTCAAAGYKMVEIDDAAENLFVRTTANARIGTGNIHIGGTDGVAEGKWVWDGTTTQFWQGGPIVSGGAAVGGRYTDWDPDEPNDSGGAEDCSEMKVDGTWNDMACGTSHPFICRR